MNKLFLKLDFMTSAPSCQALPPDIGREVAFAGRSNAGKSSVLNTLARKRNLAKTSSQPGKTRHINLFGPGKAASWRLADLPGYGFAKISASEQKRWGRELADYITQRDALQGVVIVMDMRHPLTALDHQMIALCHSGEKPVHVLLSKSDKLRQNQKKSVLHKVKKELESLAPEATCSTFSARKGDGVTELSAVLGKWLIEG